MVVDKKFINKINNGNRNAEKKLFKYTKSIIKDFVENKYPNDTNEDDVSDIVIKIFEKINKFDDKKSKYSTWIINVAKNHMIDISRLYSSSVFFYSTSNNTTDSVNIACSDSGTMVTYNLASGIDLVGDYEVNDDIKALSNSIGSSDMSLLNMKYKSGYSYDEIGKEMDMDKTKVLNRVNYIKKKIKKGE